MTQSLGDRIKQNYENRNRTYLTRRIPVIMRLDGKAFHTLTRNCEKPFDDNFINCMENTAVYLLNNIQGAKCAFVQSDEISILITDFDRLNTDAWFGYSIQKMTSVSAAMASVTFTNEWGNIGLFDSRVFNIPKEEVRNYFIWRQKDWTRNSIQMFARSYFSHKELYKKSTSDIHEMLYTKNMNWANLFSLYKNGLYIEKIDKVVLDTNTNFMINYDLFDKFLYPEE